MINERKTFTPKKFREKLNEETINEASDVRNAYNALRSDVSQLVSTASKLKRAVKSASQDELADAFVGNEMQVVLQGVADAVEFLIDSIGEDGRQARKDLQRHF